MSGLWANNPETSEGKYPIVLRRDGSVLTARYFVLVLRDPCAAAALRAYADKAAELNMDEAFVADVRALAIEADARAESDPGDPDQPRHRKDDPATIAWARRAHGGASA